MVGENGKPVPGGDASEGAASKDKLGGESGEGNAPEVTQQEQAALTEDKVRQMIAEATAKAVEQAREQGRRELQSAQDRNKAIQRRLGITEKRLKETDPDAIEHIELEDYKAGKAEDESRRANEEAFNAFKAKTSELLKEFDVDPDNKAIDWGENAPTFQEAYERVWKSAKKIRAEFEKSSSTRKEAELEAKITARIRRELELDSVDTSNGGGVTGDTAWKSKWASGELPATKENLAKAKKLLEL